MPFIDIKHRKKPTTLSGAHKKSPRDRSFIVIDKRELN